MAEDTPKENSGRNPPTPETAKATLERLQRKGILPVREETAAAKKAFPQKPEERAKIVASYPGEETIPSEVKRELTEEARKLNTIAMGTGSEVTPETPPTSPVQTPVKESPKRQQVTPAPEKEFSVAEEERSQAEQNAAWAERVLAENRAEKLPAETPEPVKIASQEVAPAAAPWIKKEQARMVSGTQRAAVGVGAAPQARPPLPTTEQVAAKQSIEKGQQIKKRWLDRIPFLRILRGERNPA